MNTVERRVIKPLYNHVLRPYLPKKWAYHGGGVFVRNARLFDRSDVDYKPAAQSAIRRHISSGDHVVEIATGYGVFACWAAKQGATVDTYEGAREKLELARETVRCNQVNERVEIHSAIVGNPVDLFGTPVGTEKIGADELPNCDVLLLDCEGSELDILTGLDQRPGKIIVETHPRHGAPTDDVSALLQKLGFEIRERQVMNDPGGNNLLVAVQAEYEAVSTTR